MTASAIWCRSTAARVQGTTLYDQEGIRVDVENPAPGKRPGRIQVHSGGKYWHYNPDTNSLEGNPPNAVKQAVQNDPKIIAALKKALKYLDRAGD
jgi:filamentous hemagglutinin